MPKYRRGSGSIYLKRGWCYLKYYVAGKPVYEAARTKNKAEARRLLQARLGQLAESRYVGPAADRVTFDDLAEMLVDDYRMNARKTLRWSVRRVHLHLAPTFGGKKAHDITTVEIKAYIVKRQEEGAQNGTIVLELNALKRMFNLGLQAGKITKKPFFPPLEVNNVRQGFFERHDFESLLAHLPDYLRPPVTFAYRVGWRFSSEVLPLRWSQVDLEEGTVRLEVLSTKNKDGRLIYLPRDLLALLEEQWREHLTHYPACPFVFHRYGNEIRRPDRSWKTACKKTGLLGKIPHDFRRTAVRNMVRAGIPERVAMQISGHKTRSIFDRYHIVSDGDLRDAARRLDAAIATPTVTISATLPSLLQSTL